MAYLLPLDFLATIDEVGSIAQMPEATFTLFIC